MNPCRCGYAGDPARNCNKYPRCIGDYQARLSGPLLDRIDLHVHVGAVSALDMTLPPPAEGSAEVAARVAAARGRQTARGVRSNAELEGEKLEAFATPDEAGRKLVMQAAEKLRLSRAARRGCCASRAPSPIWRAPKSSAGSTLPRRYPIG